MNFLPQNYRAPNTSNYYVKLIDGENRIRILSRPIMGWEDWLDNKPVRYQLDDKPAKSFDKTKPIKHFWSLIVFNYGQNAVQIMHITQNSIRKSLEALCRDTDWGDPYHYDIKITKSGQGLETEYTINPVPHRPLDEEIIKAFKDNPCNLEALFTNSDPFSGEWARATPLGIEDVDLEKFEEEFVHEEYITKAQADNISKMIAECEPNMIVKIKDFIEKLAGTRDFNKIRSSIHEKIWNIVQKKRNDYAAKQSEVDTSEVPF
jgi:hypothetical protein